MGKGFRYESSGQLKGTSQWLTPVEHNVVLAGAKPLLRLPGITSLYGIPLPQGHA